MSFPLYNHFRVFAVFVPTERIYIKITRTTRIYPSVLNLLNPAEVQAPPFSHGFG